jgi:hypothetical protein
LYGRGDFGDAGYDGHVSMGAFRWGLPIADTFHPFGADMLLREVPTAIPGAYHNSWRLPQFLSPTAILISYSNQLRVFDICPLVQAMPFGQRGSQVLH